MANPINRQPNRRPSKIGPNRPPLLPGLLFYGDTLQPRSMWQNVGATTIANTDGQAVWRFNGIPAGPIPALLKNAGGPMFYQTESGVPVLESTAVGNCALQYDIPNAPKTINRLTVYTLCRTASLTTTPNSLAACGSGLNVPNLSFQGNATAYYVANGFSTWTYPGYVASHDFNYHVHAIVWDGATGRIWTYMDGAMTSPGFTSGLASSPFGPDPAATSQNISIYSFGKTFGGSSVARFAAVGFYDAVHTPGEVRAMTEFLRNRFSALFPDPNKPIIVYMGASLLSIQQPLSAPVIMYNNSVTKPYDYKLAVRGGSVSPYIWRRLAEDGAMHIADKRGMKVAFLYGGGNDGTITDAAVGTPFNGTQQAAFMVKFANDCRAAGFNKVVIGTNLPRASVPSGDKITYNNIIKANSVASGGTAFDLVIDWGGDQYIGGETANLVTLYYVDGIHVTPSGAAIMGSSLYSNQLDTLFA